MPAVTAWQAWANAVPAAGRCSPHERFGGDRTERARTHRRLGRGGEQLGEQLRFRRRLTRAHRAQHAEREPVEAAGEVRQPAQRRRVSPVDVIDDEQSGARAARLVASQTSPRAAACIASPAARRFGGIAGPGPVAPGRPRRPSARSMPRCAQRLKQLARHAPRRVLLERTAARPQHREAVGARRSRRPRRAEVDLPIPAAPSTAMTRPDPARTAPDGGASSRELSVAIEQQLTHAFDRTPRGRALATGHAKDRGRFHDALRAAPQRRSSHERRRRGAR